MTTMRVLAVTPYYLPEGGGLERYAHEILRRLVDRGHSVDALSFTHEGQTDGTMGGVTVRRVHPMLRLGKTPVDLRFVRDVRRTIRETRPDVVIAHTPVPFAAEMAWLAARIAKVPFVTTFHAGRLQAGSKALQGVAALDRATLQRRMLAESSALVAVSPFVRDHALSAHRDRVTIVPPGVDAETFRPNGAPDAPSVLFVAPLDRAYRWKGLDVLWRAFTSLRRDMPEARLTLVGSGDRYKEFAGKARLVGDTVRLPGRLPEEALIEEYQKATVTVLPSTTDAESFGMTLAEANACGRPVVASEIGGIPSFVRDGDNGFLVPPGDADALRERLGLLLEEPGLADRMGDRGRRRVLAEHDWDRLANATERVLIAAVAAPRTPRRVELARWSRLG